MKLKLSKDKALETLKKYRSSPKKAADTNDTNSDDISLDADEFKDMEQNDDKLYGTELYNELPYEERRIKFEENVSFKIKRLNIQDSRFINLVYIRLCKINKYRSSIDDMTRMREELSKELEAIQSAKESTSSTSSSSGSETSSRQAEAILRSQIKHVSEQIKCVGFLLMQAQLGLEAINDEMIFQKKSSSSLASSSSPPRPPPPPPVIPELDVQQTSDESRVEASNLIELEASGEAESKPPELIVTNSSQDEEGGHLDDLSTSTSNKYN